MDNTQSMLNYITEHINGRIEMFFKLGIITEDQLNKMVSINNEGKYK